MDLNEKLNILGCCHYIAANFYGNDNGIKTILVLTG